MVDRFQLLKQYEPVGKPNEWINPRYLIKYRFSHCDLNIHLTNFTNSPQSLLIALQIKFLSN